MSPPAYDMTRSFWKKTSVVIILWRQEGEGGMVECEQEILKAADEREIDAYGLM